MNNKSPRSKFIENKTLKEECRRIVGSDSFKHLLKASLDSCGPYKITASFNDLPHVQDRIDGGRSAIAYFINQLMTLPYKEAGVEEEDRFIDPIDAVNSNLV